MSAESSQNQTPSPANETQTTQSHPTMADNVEPAFGWTAYAERLNGRFAMIGFVLLLLIELVTGMDLFTWLGLR
ncbi:chlorophyll a/b-binding protein [Geitlerinema sp. PCC 9228]|jgi:hypothetical protein|uniref:chlorophyll a/b-binding protein n=1 Tax=Geitlerinema sp. PCC 9228 TaxID=111611 RepID=UPI001FCD8200|nr:chlorophyll a/b-binding protein [Geitlerinema sp. PCC 9228]